MADSNSTFTRASAAYERIMVPAVFGPWALDLLETVGPALGTRFLDVACGTGIVARLASPRVGSTGRAVGVDTNEAMLAVARAQPVPAGAPIEWRHGDATSLPFEDAEFDTVLCQQGLQYVRDRPVVIREMKRVLASAGRLGISVFTQSIGYQVFEQTAARFVGNEAAAILREPFAFADLGELLELVKAVGFSIEQVHTKTLNAQFSAANDFINYQLGGRLANAVGKLNDEERGALVLALQAEFGPYTSSTGLVFPMEAHVVVARK
ncbi:MAG TPA: methyltransferase domain-containing protein [Candidatus Binatia bacterium]|nr:methyltransferase domain-containing protein [Candidatus Binatia bacterium]